MYSSTSFLKTTKRKRSENFTTEEELHLLEEIHKYKDIIECKTTNKVTSLEKEKAWKNVLSALQSKYSKWMRPRTIEQLKTKYDNLKTKARKDVAEEKNKIKQTGGGPSYPDNRLNPITEAVLNIINYKTVIGLESCDSDSTNNTTKVTATAEVNDNCELLNEDITKNCTAILDITEDNSLQNFNTSILLTDNLNVVKNECSDLNFIPKKKECQIQKQHTQIARNKYVPRMLKQQKNSKLKLVKDNPISTAKEEYYRRKLRLLDEKEHFKRAEREKRMERDNELHQKRMMLLQLKIDVKKKRLEKLLEEEFSD
jgi:hypothetical protein